MSFKRKFERYNKPKHDPVFVEAYREGKYEAPQEPRVAWESETLQRKSFGRLSNIGVIDVKADPNAEMSYGAFPYTIIGATSPVLDASYPGDDNITGNTITMIQNDTTSSQLMNLFDVAVVVEEINYCYLPIKSGSKNVALAAEMIKSIEQAISFGFSTMLTQLPFATNTYDSDIVLPADLPIATTKASGYYAGCIHYQTTLQNLVMPIAKYIELRSLEKELMRMSFRTEAPLVTSLFGYFKKAAFVANINTLGTVLINEYFDKNWYTQMNTLLTVPSRKTKGMSDPLLTLVGVHNVPSLKITASGGSTPYYDSTDAKWKATASFLDPEDLLFKNNTILDLKGLILNVCKLMNPAYIMRFLRLYNRNQLPTPGSGQAAITGISAYVEAVKMYLDYINRFAAAFSTAMSDIRTFLDKLSQSQMVYWEKGCAFYVDKIAQLEPKFNILLHDVFAASVSGSDKVQFDALTLRWRAWSLWHKYHGIPEYDRRSGGCFLTFGLRVIAPNGSTGAAVDFRSSPGLIPVLFSNASTPMNMAVSRNGVRVQFSYFSLSGSTVLSNHALARLNILNSNSFDVKLPVADLSAWSSDTAQVKAKLSSVVGQFMLNAFGYGGVKFTGASISNVVDVVVDNDLIGIIEHEIEDVSNDIIIFARNYAPFRVNTPDPRRTVGFAAKK